MKRHELHFRLRHYKISEEKKINENPEVQCYRDCEKLIFGAGGVKK